jgi:hypothetical protein
MSASALELETVLLHLEYPMKLLGREGQVMNATWPDSAMCSITHAGRKSCMGDCEDPLLDYSDILWSPRPMHPSSFSCAPPHFINLGTIFLLRRRAVTPRVTKILIKWLQMQLSLKAREDQAVKVSNQNLNYQDFKFEVPKCYLLLTNILS